MAKLSIASTNVQGLGNFKKRRDVFQYLRQKSYSIFFLQDTHFDAKLEPQIRAEWGYEAIFASHTTQSRGVAILFNNNFDFKILEVIKDPQGNYLIVRIKTFDQELTLVNIYGPNDDSPQFYHKIQDTLNNLQNHNLILGGDWNLVLNPALDYFNYKHNNNPKARDKVLTMLSDLDLLDIWREINPEVLRFTWRRPTPAQQARLDFFLVSENLAIKLKEADILNSYRSDHSSVMISFEFASGPKASNFWKFNSNLLRDKMFVEDINNTIKIIKEQYAIPVYNRDNLNKIPTSELQLSISDQLFLDVLLMEIRKKSMEYSSKKKRENEKREKDLDHEIIELEKKLQTTVREQEILQVKKEELVNLRKVKMDGILLRSKAKWAAEGEKVSQYFCNLEKRHFVSKQMYKLISKQGKTLTDSNDMLKETQEFYQNLNARKQCKDVDLHVYVDNIPKLTEFEANSIEGMITLEEASISLKNMKNGKSPGTDGFTVDFFKFFWRELGPLVVRSLNEGFIKKQMSISQREGIIIGIPKGDKPREYLNNWRPITLLNVTYKIGSTCIANRLKSVLLNLINEDQTGFLPGRYIGDNIRLLYDTMEYLNTNNLPGLLVSIDFSKAFDSINWNYMHKVMKEFGFGEDICQWIEAFYCNLKSSVIVNGKASPQFNVEQGCRQGDPVSPYIFILCAEILAIKIRENQDIKGIKILDIESKISQFADDTCFLLEGEERSFTGIFKTLDDFGDFSGLKVNFDKTFNVWLGSRRNSNIRYMTNKNMKWNPLRFKILGLWFTNDLDSMTEINIKDKFNEVKKLFNTWTKRNITPLGRVAILKSLILSKLVFLWLTLPNPPDKLINELQKMCFDFVWNHKIDKIKRTIATHNIEKGGINIPDIQKYIIALKVAWVRKLLHPRNPKWKQFLYKISPEIESLPEFGPVKFKQHITNPFWLQVFKGYCQFYDKVEISSSAEILAEPILYNNKFKSGCSVIRFQEFIRHGILKVKDLIKEDGTFYTFNEFSTKHHFTGSWLDYLSCINAIKSYTKKNNILIHDRNPLNQTKALNVLQSTLKGTKAIYITLLGLPVLAKACQNWVKMLGVIEWQKIFSQTKRITEIKLRWFQIKINYRILVSNSILKEMGISTSNLCNFCQTEKDSIFHYLWHCQYTQIFWNNLLQCLHEKCQNTTRLTFSPTLILFGQDKNTKTDDGFDFILIQAKFFVYKCRINKLKPTSQLFLKELQWIYKTDKLVYHTNMKQHDFLTKWFPYRQLIDNE